MVKGGKFINGGHKTERLYPREGPTMAIVNPLSLVAIFAELEHEELDRLFAELTRRTFQKGEVIFHQDDPGNRLYFLVEGLVTISIVSRDGRENDIALMNPGDCFGEMSVLDGGSRSATAIAVEATETMTLSRDDFLSFLREHTSMAVQIIKLLVHRLRTTDEMMGDMVFMDVPARVAKKLMDLAHTNRSSPTPDGHITVPIGQEELSRLVGSSREAVTRALATYRRMGVLTTSHRMIRITDPQGLEKLATS